MKKLCVSCRCQTSWDRLDGWGHCLDCQAQRARDRVVLAVRLLTRIQDGDELWDVSPESMVTIPSLHHDVHVID